MSGEPLDRGGKLAIDLTIGDYDLAVQVAGMWENLFQASFAGTLQAGGVLDLGEVEVS